MPKNTTQRIIDAKTLHSGAVFSGGTGGGSTGVTDHGALTGLADDDHGQYHTDARGDARYVPLARTVTAGAGLTGGGTLSGNITLTVGAGNGITVNADDVALTTPGNSGAGSVALGTNAAAGSHTHAILTSNNPGANAYVLSSTAAGALTLEGLTVNGAPLSAGASAGYVFAERTDPTTTVKRWALYADTGRAILYNDATAEYRFATGGTVVTPAGMTLKPVSDLVLDPDTNLAKLASGVSLQSDNFASQTTGMRVTYGGEGDFRYLYTDELHAKSFIADLEQALAGGQIISKSVAMLGAAFTAPAAGATATLTVRDLPSAENMAVFQSGDIVRLRTFSRSGGSLTIADCWGVVTSYSDQADKLQTWTFTRSAAPNAGTMAASTVVAVDSIVLDYGTTGNGFHEVNAIDGAYGANSPYSQIVTWATHPATGQTVRTRLGNLVGIFSVANEYGLFAGTGSGTTDSWLRISSLGAELHNLPIKLYNGSTQTVNVSSTGADIWVGPSSSDKRLTWNGTTLTIVGAVTVTGGNANITVGTGTKDGNLSGWNIGATEIVGQAGDGSDQVVMDTTGKIKFGAGNGVLDASGVALYYDADTSPEVWSRITWYNTPATRTTEIGSIAFGDDDSVYAPEAAPATRGHALRIKSTNAIAPDIYVQSTSASYEVWHQGNDGPSSGLDADTLDTYQAAAFGRLAASQTWTDTQYFSKSNGIGFDVRVDTSGLSKGFRIVTTGALATSTDTDQFQFYHVANDLWTMESGDLSGNRHMVLNPTSGNVGIGTGTTAPAYKLEVNGTAHIVGALTSAGAIGGTWSTMTTLGTNSTVSGRDAQSRRFGDITYLRGAINPADDTGPLDLVTIATTTHRPARTQYLVATSVGNGTEPSVSRTTIHLKIHTDGIIECYNNTTDIQLISFDGLFFFNA